MGGHLGSRIAQVIPTLILVSILVFGLQQLMPGDPAMILVPPAAQFQGEYVFLVPAEYETNWVTILRPSGAAVSLDGVDQTNAGAWQNVGTLDGTMWQRGHFSLPFGPHRVEIFHHDALHRA